MKRKLLTLAVLVCMLATLVPSGMIVSADVVQLPDEGYMNFGSVTLASALHGQPKTFQFGSSGVIPFIRDFTYYTKVSGGYEATLTDNFANNANWESAGGHTLYYASNNHLRPGNRDDNSARLKSAPDGSAMANNEYAVTFSAAFSTLDNPRFFMGVRGVGENLSGITGLAHSPYLELNGTKMEGRESHFSSSRGCYWNGGGLSGLSGADADLFQVYSSSIAGNAGPNNNLNPPADTLPDVYYDFKIVVTTDTATLYIKEQLPPEPEDDGLSEEGYSKFGSVTLAPALHGKPKTFQFGGSGVIPFIKDFTYYAKDAEGAFEATLTDNFANNSNWEAAGGHTVYSAANGNLRSNNRDDNSARLKSAPDGGAMANNEYAVTFSAAFATSGNPRFFMGVRGADENVSGLTGLAHSPYLELNGTKVGTDFSSSNGRFWNGSGLSGLSGADADLFQVYSSGAAANNPGPNNNLNPTTNIPDVYYDFLIKVSSDTATLFIKEPPPPTVELPTEDYVKFGSVTLAPALHGQPKTFQFGSASLIPFIKDFTYYRKDADGYRIALEDNFTNNANWEGVSTHPIYSAAHGNLRPNNRDDNSARLRNTPGGSAMANNEYAVTFSAAFATAAENARFFMGVRGADENLSGLTGLAHSPYLELNGTQVGTQFNSSNGRFWNGSGLSGLSGADSNLFQVYSSAVAGGDGGPNNNLNPTTNIPDVYYDFKIVVSADTATLYIKSLPLVIEEPVFSGTGVSVGGVLQDGEITVTYNVTSVRDTSAFVPILALYDERDVLQDIKISAPQSVLLSGEVAESITVSDVQPGYYIKAYLWNDFIAMKPYSIAAGILEGPEVVASLNMRYNSINLFANQSIDFPVNITLNPGEVLPANSITWTSSNPLVARIVGADNGARGLVAVSPGTAIITASVNNSTLKATSTVTVTDYNIKKKIQLLA